jgi:hypothetical protein
MDKGAVTEAVSIRNVNAVHLEAVHVVVAEGVIGSSLYA